MPGNIWTARSFYVWLSVFNLLTVSVAWSVLSDVMKPGQMKRLFALIASGSSLGAMTGPAVTAALAGVAGPSVVVPCRRCSSGAGDAGGNVPAPLV